MGMEEVRGVGEELEGDKGSGVGAVGFGVFERGEENLRTKNV